MFNKLSRIICVALTLALVLVASGCGAATASSAPVSSSASVPSATSAASAPKNSTAIQICGATSGGTYFLLANAIAQMLNTNVGDWFKASAQSTGGTPANIRLMEDGETDFAFGQSGVAQQAMEGLGSFDKKYTNFASVTYVYPNVMQIGVRKDAKITSFADFKGKTFCAGASGSATELNTRDMFAAAGIAYEDSTIEYTSETQSADLIKNRQAQGANLIAALGAAAMTDLMSSGDCEIYSFSDEEIKAICAMNPAYFEFTIPAGTYPNQDKEVKTFAVANYIFCRADLSEDIVYQFTKAIYENADTLKAAHKAAGDIKPENCVNGLTVPLHPGAEKYYKEIGALK
ncbi:NMT1-like family protein [anaerobic digester metagenome]